MNARAQAPIERIGFGRTGHESSRVIFGAAALAAMREARAQGVLELLLEYGINHIDTAASYGESELRLAPWLREHRDRFFLATKTGDRSGAAARASLHRSLERMQIDRVDMIQLHNLVDEAEWNEAMGPGGALEALVDARSEGLVRFIGVTGHGSHVAAMHRRSLERFEFDSVLLPYNFTMMQIPSYAADFERLLVLAGERRVAVQTIKSIARRRWPDGSTNRFSWYEPLTDPEAIRHAVGFVLRRPGVFLNTCSDARLLATTLATAAEGAHETGDERLAADAQRHEMQPLFVPGVSDSI